MAETITRYRVFIASPGGLEDVRKAFRETINAYNSEIDQLDRDATFLPMGWEETLGGIGRPQSLINEDIKKCDYLVLILKDRWGSLPDTIDKTCFSSACEEEYNVALKCLNDTSFPMRQIIIFFKAVPPEQLQDPGDQLKKVLAFRRKIESDKKDFFHTFDEISKFREILRLHLAKWLCYHEKNKP